MTKPCPHPNSWFSRSLCSLDDWMHTYCTECQDPLDGECGDRAANIREMKPGPVETPGTEAGIPRCKHGAPIWACNEHEGTEAGPSAREALKFFEDNYGHKVEHDGEDNWARLRAIEDALDAGERDAGLLMVYRPVYEAMRDTPGQAELADIILRGNTRG